MLAEPVHLGGHVRPFLLEETYEALDAIDRHDPDALAGEPSQSPLSVEDYAHTVYHLLGIDARKGLMTPGDRPQPIVANGQVVKGLLA